MKSCLISSLTLLLYGNQQADFTYKVYLNGTTDQVARGHVCAKLPYQLYFSFKDHYQPDIVIKQSTAKIIDWRLQQVTEIDLNDQPIYKLLKNKSALENLCLEQNNAKYCISFKNINNYDCQLNPTVPKDFDYIRS